MIHPMPAASETLPVLEQRLAERLLAFERLERAQAEELKARAIRVVFASRVIRARNARDVTRFISSP